jgi:NAD(P)-dependent dehydrogenase (short-subunit alcohol dehydrogenase family)
VEISAGERVLITGASSGIGLATALAYGRRGARVGLLARGADGLERAAEMVADAGGRPLAVPADVTDWSGLEGAVAAAVEELGGLDIAVSSAAGLYYGASLKRRPRTSIGPAPPRWAVPSTSVASFSLRSRRVAGRW